MIAESSARRSSAVIAPWLAQGASTYHPLAEDGDIERFAWPEPDYVRRVIGKIISRFSVGEDCEIAAIEDDPCSKLPKSLLGNGELTASTWVRPDRPFVEAADFDPERSLRLPSERLSCAQFVRIEIDVGVEVSKIAHPTKIVRLRRRSRAERAPLPPVYLQGP